jgi:hypothetical protein
MTPKFKIGDPVNMEDTDIDMPALDNLDDMIKQDFRTVDVDVDPMERDANILIVKPRIINDRGCMTLINMHENAVFDDVTIENEHDITPSETVQKFNLSYKYKASNEKGENKKEHMTLAEGSTEFKKAMEVVGSQIPDHRDFDRITYMQIVRYDRDSFFMSHRDEAQNDVGRDYGTCIVQLNEDYHGGSLNVEGCIIPKRAGTMAFFNNSSEVWHGVEPIYDGSRYVLLIWFGREYDDSEVQPVPEGTDNRRSEISLEDSQ